MLPTSARPWLRRAWRPAPGLQRAPWWRGSSSATQNSYERSTDKPLERQPAVHDPPGYLGRAPARRSRVQDAPARSTRATGATTLPRCASRSSPCSRRMTA
eukprot:6207797-Pleurochrysis_carterae.AAC.1